MESVREESLLCARFRFASDEVVTVSLSIEVPKSSIVKLKFL